MKVDHEWVTLFVIASYDPALKNDKGYRKNASTSDQIRDLCDLIW